MEKKSNTFFPAGHVIGRQLFLFLILLSASTVVFSQTPIRVTGTVKDAKGAALTGVSITLKGATTGATSDVNGQYSISVPSKESVLLFSFVGYLTKEQQVKEQQIINATLTDKTNDLEEVVVIGYGQTQKKRDVGGA